MRCMHCRKDKIVTITIDAAPQIPNEALPKPHKDLRAQLADEGKGAVAGALVLCVPCWRDGLATTKDAA